MSRQEVRRICSAVSQTLYSHQAASFLHQAVAVSLRLLLLVGSQVLDVELKILPNHLLHSAEGRLSEWLDKVVT